MALAGASTRLSPRWCRRTSFTFLTRRWRRSGRIDPPLTPIEDVVSFPSPPAPQRLRGHGVVCRETRWSWFRDRPASRLTLGATTTNPSRGRLSSPRGWRVPRAIRTSRPPPSRHAERARDWETVGTRAPVGTGGGPSVNFDKLGGDTLRKIIVMMTTASRPPTTPSASEDSSPSSPIISPRRRWTRRRFYKNGVHEGAGGEVTPHPTRPGRSRRRPATRAPPARLFNRGRPRAPAENDRWDA